jgi:two-component system response regulator YesN
LPPATPMSLSVHSIADEMGMNPAYLGRQYKEATGLSIADSVKQVRIAKARELLQETDRSVKEIAEKVGFANDKYFFVVFKELVGMTPMEFRRSFQGKQC